MTTLPRLALLLTGKFDAWVVGSAADPKSKSPRDYDVVVPWHRWDEASSLIQSDARPNSFGGWKCGNVDVWPGDLGNVMQYCKAVWAWQPHTGIRLKKVIFSDGANFSE